MKTRSELGAGNPFTTGSADGESTTFGTLV